MIWMRRLLGKRKSNKLMRKVNRKKNKNKQVNRFQCFQKRRCVEGSMGC